MMLARLGNWLRSRMRERRRVVRFRVRGVTAQCRITNNCFRVRDVSLGGMGLRGDPGKVAPGSRLTLDILAEGRTTAQGVTAEVTHCAPGRIGCRFLSLDPEQAKGLDSIVLRGWGGLIF